MTPPTPVARFHRFSAAATRLLRRLAPQRGLVAAVVTLSVGSIAIGVAGPRILGRATDLLFSGFIGRGLPAGLTKQQVIAQARAAGRQTYADMLSEMDMVPGRGIDFNAVGRTLVLALLLYLAAAVMIWLQARLLNLIVQRTMVALRADIEDKVHRLPLSYFDSRQRGELLSRVTGDVDNTQTSISIVISQLFGSVLTVLAALVMMMSISPLLTAIALGGLPPSVLAIRAITRRSQQMFTAQWAATGQLSAHIEETYSGLTVVRTLDRCDPTFTVFNDEVYRVGFRAQFFSGLLIPATGLIANLGYVAVAVVGGIQVATGRITLGSIQAFIAYLRQFNQPVGNLASMYNTVQSGMASAERIFEFLDEPEEPSETAATVTFQNAETRGRVEFHNVSFCYQPGLPVIQDLSLKVESGSTVAIVGPTGAGKTTLVNLLMRFYDVDAGKVLIGGVDIASMSRRELRAQTGLVPQDTWLFAGTIAENIRYGRPDATDGEVLEAARAAHVDRFASALPDGYRTRVDDDAAGISAGEKQLITIARVFLRRPQLLILDEATSSVDTRTELLIQRATRQLRRGRTCFIIAHRLSTIRDADVILVMRAGRIVEQGSHPELLARRGAYWEMVHK